MTVILVTAASGSIGRFALPGRADLGGDGRPG
jgi:hypothetical protein